MSERLQGLAWVLVCVIVLGAIAAFAVDCGVRREHVTDCIRSGHSPSECREAFKP